MNLRWNALGILTLIAGLLAAAGCGHWQYDQFPAPSWNPRGLATPRLDQRDRVYAYPGSQSLRTGRAGLMEFRTVPDFANVGPAFTRIFHRELLAKRAFTDVVLIPAPYYTDEDALRQAKRHKVDVLLLGEIPYYLDGGTVGNSGLQVDLKVIEAGSGRLLWNLSDSIKATRRPIIDLIVTETRPYPTPSMGSLASRLAGQVAAKLEQGQPPPPAPSSGLGIIGACFKGS
jgi:hypothetical protein|uniref:Uncharacterized protein n=1 Tax=Desulfobacca acetoxidans TaxID=60893 RepID=A0A7V6A5W1_9BACT